MPNLIRLSPIFLVATAISSMLPSPARDAGPGLFGGGHGLRHVVILVPEPGKAAQEYRSLLGFTPTVSAKAGSDAASYVVSFGNGSSLVIGAIGDGRTAGGADGVPKELEGGAWAALEVSSVERAAKFLQNRSIHLHLSAAGEIPPAGREAELLKGVSGSLRTAEPGVLGRTLLFVERNRGAPDETGETPFAHANSARRLAAVWIAVSDIEATASRCEAMGMPLGKAFTMPQLGARGQEIKVGQGTLLLLQPDDPFGTLAAVLKERGEGIVGMTVEVERITSARRLLVASTREDLPTYRGLYGRSLLIPPDLTHGVWIEMFQP